MCTLFSGAGIWYTNVHEKQNFVCPWGTLQKEFLNAGRPVVGPYRFTAERDHRARRELVVTSAAIP